MEYAASIADYGHGRRRERTDLLVLLIQRRPQQSSCAQASKAHLPIPMKPKFWQGGDRSFTLTSIRHRNAF